MAFGPPRAPDDGSASSGQPLDSAIVRATSPALSPATTTVGSSSTHHRGRDGVGDTGVSPTPSRPRWWVEDEPTVVVAGDSAGLVARTIAESNGWPLLAEPSSGARGG